MSGAMMDCCAAFGADFEGADLSGAILWGAHLEGANFVGADLSTANTEGAHFEGAVFDSTTVWPHGFDPLEAGAIRVGDDTGVYYRIEPAPGLFGSPDGT